jgi:hypothetical protein
MALTVETAERRLPKEGKRCAEGEAMEWTNEQAAWARAKLRRLLLKVAKDCEDTARRLRAFAR